MTPDEHFIIDGIPSLKTFAFRRVFGPWLSLLQLWRALADLALEGKTELPQVF
jgi:hypothetical protein